MRRYEPNSRIPVRTSLSLKRTLKIFSDWNMRMQTFGTCSPCCKEYTTQRFNTIRIDLYPKNIFIRPQEGSDKLLRFEETMQSAFPNPEDRAFAEDRKNWNTLPNLQLLEGSQNESKGDTPLAEWAKRTGKSAVSFYVPANTNLDLANFKPFIEARRDAIRLKLLAILKPEAS